MDPQNGTSTAVAERSAEALQEEAEEGNAACKSLAACGSCTSRANGAAWLIVSSTYGVGLRWLEPGERGGKRIVIASYPRSGNSLMRSLVEQITGIYTGSDTRPERSLSKALKEMGLQGEVNAAFQTHLAAIRVA